MKNYLLSAILKVLLILLGISALFFQVFQFFFSTLNKSANSEGSSFLSDTIPHLTTIFICLWFIIHLLFSITKHKNNGSTPRYP